MKRIIREGVFESNSSSSHSISVVTKKQKFELPKKLTFEVHEFNNCPEDDDDMDTVEGRANYLYAAAISFDQRKEFKKRVKKLLGEKIELKFKKIPKWMKEEGYCNLINHQALDEAEALLNVCMDKDKILMNYLFDDKTEIEICGDWAMKGVTSGEDRLVFGYTKEDVRKWENGQKNFEI